MRSEDVEFLVRQNKSKILANPNFETRKNEVIRIIETNKKEVSVLSALHDTVKMMEFIDTNNPESTEVIEILKLSSFGRRMYAVAPSGSIQKERCEKVNDVVGYIYSIIMDGIEE